MHVVFVSLTEDLALHPESGHIFIFIASSLYEKGEQVTYIFPELPIEMSENGLTESIDIFGYAKSMNIKESEIFNQDQIPSLIQGIQLFLPKEMSQEVALLLGDEAEYFLIPPDIIHVGDWKSGLFALKFKKAYEAKKPDQSPFLIYNLSQYYFPYDESFFLKRTWNEKQDYKKIFKEFDKIIVDSLEMKKEIIKKYPDTKKYEKKFLIIHEELFPNEVVRGFITLYNEVIESKKFKDWERIFSDFKRE